MERFVLDASVTMCWCFIDEANSYADAVLQCLNEQEAVVPSIWPLEVLNVLLVAERRQRLTKADSMRFLTVLRALPISVENPSQITTDDALSLGREHNISAYDATYLELAMREGLPLATLDERLRNAAQAAGVQIIA